MRPDSTIAPAAPPIVRFDNLTLGYQRHPAVHHLHGDIAASLLSSARMAPASRPCSKASSAILRRWKGG